MIMKVSILVIFFIFLFTMSEHILETSDIMLPSEADEGRNGNEIKTYIIHLAKPKTRKLLGNEELESWHKSFLPNLTLDSGELRLVYSYFEVMTGFAARLTPNEVKAMQCMDGFLHAELDIQRSQPRPRTALII